MARYHLRAPRTWAALISQVPPPDRVDMHAHTYHQFRTRQPTYRRPSQPPHINELHYAHWRTQGARRFQVLPQGAPHLPAPRRSRLHHRSTSTCTNTHTNTRHTNQRIPQASQAQPTHAHHHRTPTTRMHDPSSGYPLKPLHLPPSQHRPACRHRDTSCASAAHFSKTPGSASTF